MMLAPFSTYVLIFIAGIAGSLHCVGMCGGFVCGLSADPRGRAATLRRHLIYNGGRLTTYCFFGAVVGALGAELVTHGGGATPVSAAQRLLAVVSGVLMVFIGLQFFGFFRRFHNQLPGLGSTIPALRGMLKSPSPAAPLAFGVLNGFLPCPLVYAFVAQSAASGGALPGLIVMLAFGLGTFPAMLAMGGVGIWLRSPAPSPGVHTFQADLLKRRTGTGALPRPHWRLQGVRVAGGFIVLLGLVTFARGVLPLAAHLHHL